MKEFGLVLNEKQAEMLLKASMHPNQLQIAKLDAAMKEVEKNIEITENGFSFELSIDIDKEINGNLAEQKTDIQTKDKFELVLDKEVEIMYQIDFNRQIFKADLGSTEMLCAA